ncbi:phenoloxidase-activating factor 2-like isoform X2 [Drosophila takahashii]|uniref:phenoloxidase-activating factor 2-like isoform X2 n=1 Tax=Drosophila takahashii TaxID=29030 RepID=UPI001CF92D30|nr:phenoloxidase-activating factor 2-like isoform X2 [Drosophila takahashii]
MRRFWAIEVLLLGYVVLGEACKYCVPKENCLQQSTTFYSVCFHSEVCCEVLRDNNDIWSQKTETVEQQAVFTYGPLPPQKKVPEIGITYWPPTTTPPPPQPTTQIPKSGEIGQKGLSNPLGLDLTKCVTDEQAKPGQYPWVVALFNGSQYWSGGSLISAGVVLTAAHRVWSMKPDQIVVRAGEWDIESETESFRSEERDVERIVVHESFDYLTGGNNLALLFLKTPFELKNHIRPIGLPQSIGSLNGRRCTAAGWGKITFQAHSYSSILKKVELPIVERKTCQDMLRRTKLGWSYNLAQSLICAGGESDKDTCYGDGGSALFCSVEGGNPDIYEQVGIVNWGMDCGQKDVPGTYTDVALFRDWILPKIVPFTFKKSG